MGVTKYSELNTAQSACYIGATLPTTPAAYYGNATNDVDSIEWHGGEMAFLNGSASASGKFKLYIQTATSGVTATWKRRQDVFTAA
jgi:hypothetical protein